MLHLKKCNFGRYIHDQNGLGSNAGIVWADRPGLNGALIYAAQWKALEAGARAVFGNAGDKLGSWNAALGVARYHQHSSCSVTAQVEARGWKDFWDNHAFSKGLFFLENRRSESSIVFPGLGCWAGNEQFAHQEWCRRVHCWCGSWHTPPGAINSAVDVQGE